MRRSQNWFSAAPQAVDLKPMVLLQDSCADGDFDTLCVAHNERKQTDCYPGPGSPQSDTNQLPPGHSSDCRTQPQVFENGCLMSHVVCTVNRGITTHQMRRWTLLVFELKTQKVEPHLFDSISFGKNGKDGADCFETKLWN